MNETKRKQVAIPKEAYDLLQEICRERLWKQGVAAGEAIKHYAERHGIRPTQPRRSKAGAA